ncbi:hypothetical protein SAMN05216226_10850 [Halovenus aranensis]|jgi:hypothetical protein|uniref:Uncharacterized protein n=1 Tax=Halovenus aranensis TaxID=890420 RepID=A0A1G8W402_9EURY|nr:hypothetical protein [Halovenus aranensis]SDJ72817.1 hypothetical protein SAMN05216226_10850 [Halovenus aranensis]
MSWGILEMLGSVTILMAVIPPALAGAGLLLGGNLVVGASLLALSVGMLVADQYVTTPGDLPGIAARKLVGIIVQPPDDE